MERSSSEETYSEAEDESQFQHFLRNDSEAELAGIIKGIGFDGSLHIEENSQSDQEQEKEDWLHNRQQQECGRIYNEHLEEERQNRRGQQQQEEESLCKEHQEEEILFREDQGGNLIRKQHENVRLHRDQFDEEERLRREYQEEKIRGEQYEEERLRREHQQDARLCSEQQEQKLRKQHLEEVERIRRDHLRQPQAQHEDKRTIKEKFSQVDSDILPNMIRHIKEDVEEEDSWEDEDSSHSLTVLPTKLCCPQALTPLSPSRPKSPWGRFDPYDSFEEDREYVGFATLPNQMHRKYVKKGFEFTLMVAGESGLGKSTLINSLFLTDLYRDRHILSPEERVTQTVEIVKQTVDIQEKGVRLHLTIVDTPGYGDAINNESWAIPHGEIATRLRSRRQSAATVAATGAGDSFAPEGLNPLPESSSCRDFPSLEGRGKKKTCTQAKKKRIAGKKTTHVPSPSLVQPITHIRYLAQLRTRMRNRTLTSESTPTFD
ncbi:hypothetical protein XELAEV_18011805mg [Xenopus laevis]|uniref:Septin-type G domain-containing protein n=1 Tax=Xenopus laevis TaxID=8355 RepID=A0A974DMZ2_XENLA|nr:hypothetical protein XELAEV_18011805mg [Xenopus laevis]